MPCPAGRPPCCACAAGGETPGTRGRCPSPRCWTASPPSPAALPPESGKTTALCRLRMQANRHNVLRYFDATWRPIHAQARSVTTLMLQYDIHRFVWCSSRLMSARKAKQTLSASTAAVWAPPIGAPSVSAAMAASCAFTSALYSVSYTRDRRGERWLLIISQTGTQRCKTVPTGASEYHCRNDGCVTGIGVAPRCQWGAHLCGHDNRMA